jgi:hypothetical protein
LLLVILRKFNNTNRMITLLVITLSDFHCIFIHKSLKIILKIKFSDIINLSVCLHFDVRRCLIWSRYLFDYSKEGYNNIWIDYLGDSVKMPNGLSQFDHIQRIILLSVITLLVICCSFNNQKTYFYNYSTFNDWYHYNWSH